MSDSLWFTVDNNIELQQGVLSRLDIELGNVLIRHFPDGESYVRVESDCRDRDIIIQCTLTEPDARILSSAPDRSVWSHLIWHICAKTNASKLVNQFPLGCLHNTFRHDLIGC